LRRKIVLSLKVYLPSPEILLQRNIIFGISYRAREYMVKWLPMAGNGPPETPFNLQRYAA
jgi:hypothetical protein